MEIAFEVHAFPKYPIIFMTEVTHILLYNTHRYFYNYFLRRGIKFPFTLDPIQMVLDDLLPSLYHLHDDDDEINALHGYNLIQYEIYEQQYMSQYKSIIIL